MAVTSTISDLEILQALQKKGYPSVFKTVGIAPKSAGIGSKFLSWRFFPRRFKPPGNECGYRVARPEKRWERHTPYISAFESAGIGTSAFKSADICLESIEFKRPIPALSVCTYSSVHKSAGIGIGSV